MFFSINIFVGSTLQAMGRTHMQTYRPPLWWWRNWRVWCLTL